MNYQVQAYADQIDSLSLQADERESYELIKTMSGNFRVEDATARELDAVMATVLGARAASRPAPAPTPAAPTPAPTPASPAAVVTRKKKAAVPATTADLNEVAARFEALFLDLLRARAGKGGGGISALELEQWLKDRRISIGDLSQDLQDDGKVLILDELPKIDPNTAGLLNEALAKTGDKLVLRPNRDELRQQIAAVMGSDVAEEALRDLNEHNTAELFYLFVEREAMNKNVKPAVRLELMTKLFTYPLLQNSRKQFFVKHPYFGVIATGNVYPSGTDMAYAANNKQDLSLLDRFAGSVYYIQKNPALERHVLQNDYVWYICNLLRDVVDKNRYEAQVSLRLMQSANRAYEQEVARHTGQQKDGLTANEGKTFAEVIESFILSGFTIAQQQLLRQAVSYDANIKSQAYRSYGAGGKKFTMPYGY